MLNEHSTHNMRPDLMRQLRICALKKRKFHASSLPKKPNQSSSKAELKTKANIQMILWCDKDCHDTNAATSG